MNNELWQLYTNQVLTNLSFNNTPLNANTTESLKATWHKIQTSVVSAALKHIPNKKVTMHNF